MSSRDGNRLTNDNRYDPASSNQFDDAKSVAEKLREAVRDDLRERPMWGELSGFGITHTSKILDHIDPKQFNQVARELEKTNTPLGLSEMPQARVVYDKNGNADEIVFSAGLFDSGASCANFLDFGRVQVCTEKSWVKVPAPRR